MRADSLGVELVRAKRPDSILAGAAIVAAVLVVVSDLIRVALGTWSPSARLPACILLGVLGVMVRRGRLGGGTLLLAGSFGLMSLSLIDAYTPLPGGGLDPTAVLGVASASGVVWAVVRSGVTLAPIILYSFGALAFAVWSVTTGDTLPSAIAAQRLSMGATGQLVPMMVAHVVVAGRAKQRTASRSLRLQAALSTCSEALLTRSGDDAVQNAVAALLDATQAGYVYVDVNSVEDGVRRWQVVADAEAPGHFDGPDENRSGTYEGIEVVEAALASGRPATIVVADLAPGSPLRIAYEREGVAAELAAPILVDGKWVGSLGFIDAVSRAWTSDEVSAATRAADMIAAHWIRQQAREGLLDLNDARSRFVASVSHELRTPLTAVIGFASELVTDLDRLDPDEIVEISRIILRQSEELAALVDDLLTMERSNVGDLTINPVEVKVTKHLAELAGALQRNVTLPDVEVVAFADPLRLRQILRNVLSNAYRHGGPNIVIDVDDDEDMVKVGIADDGNGVNPVMAERIFEEFVRRDDGGTRPDSVGLGLAVARRLAHLMGGDLVYHRHDGWTRFVLTLPKPPPGPALESVATSADQADHDPVDQGLPGRLDYVLVDADGAPRSVVV